jgi:UDP-N-acetylglucosamine 2-epimerase
MLCILSATITGKHLQVIVTLIGARPQFVKAAVVSKALKASGIEELIVHSGQHYDALMSQVFWDELNLPEPAFRLEAGSGSHTSQTAAIMVAFEAVLVKYENDVKAVLLYGDTNTTIAGALVASKRGVPVIHVEAGLRSFNREMPEEINRVVTDHLSTILFCSSAQGVEQLKSEGITRNVFEVGDVMYDAFNFYSRLAEDQKAVMKEGEEILFTLHRPSNTDDPVKLLQILEALGKAGKKVLWPVHPRNKERLAGMVIPGNISLTEPLSYLQIVRALTECRIVITDSGGLQKEAYWAGKPCLTIRSETEWVETVLAGWNKLVGPESIADHIWWQPDHPWKPLYGDGRSSERIAHILKPLIQQD